MAQRVLWIEYACFRYQPPRTLRGESGHLKKVRGLPQNSPHGRGCAHLACCRCFDVRVDGLAAIAQAHADASAGVAWGDEREHDFPRLDSAPLAL
jgi:hypothetical protein